VSKRGSDETVLGPKNKTHVTTKLRPRPNNETARPPLPIIHQRSAVDRVHYYVILVHTYIYTYNMRYRYVLYILHYTAIVS
jgi:hypothetical protein